MKKPNEKIKQTWRVDADLVDWLKKETSTGDISINQMVNELIRYEKEEAEKTAA